MKLADRPHGVFCCEVNVFSNVLWWKLDSLNSLPEPAKIFYGVKRIVLLSEVAGIFQEGRAIVIVFLFICITICAGLGQNNWHLTILSTARIIQYKQYFFLLP